ncbi:helix-turn-helix transcriptional regulator [Microbacterium sp. ABRD28]|uniref:PadR family transcriptional regulator n=1 Tax=Microbacterium sp. ABRD28 TaxID=2268461 RepID=UPI000F55677E|nr:helix-turn-helix transcriptional regulator [Microbacterium sp. ABRD28]AZC13208.1 PadR family transcriptional regulator [Microbacterium sp. ABRD28]
MKFVVLGILLMSGPQTLYSLNKEFERGPSQFYRASLGSLQTALKGLLDAGCVTVLAATERGRAKKYYTATDLGEQTLHSWIRSDQVGTDLEVAALSRLFLLGLVDDAAERRAILGRIAEQIDEELGRLEAFADDLDQQISMLPAAQQAAVRYRRATLDYGLMAHRVGLAWFRERAAEEA